MKKLLTILSFVAVFAINPLLSDSSIQLVCPPDVWLNCGAEIWDLSNYGNAYYIKNGYQYSAGNAHVVYDLTTCETGVIYRTWQVEDENWNIIECTQRIYISGGNFSSYNINWPDSELQLYGCNVSTHPDNLPDGYGRPTFDYLTCSMVGSSYKDQEFYFGPDCKKILRKWTVLDWCNYYPGSPNNGIWTYTQVIKISNTEQPDLTCEAKVEVKANECAGSYVSVPLVSVAGQSCTGSYAITHDSPYADAQGDDASGFYPVGKTIVNYDVEYACGSIMKCHTEVIVEEKDPVPYCYSALNVALMPVDTDGDGQTDDGMVELWASDLDYGSFHPCNSGPLHFSFSSDVDSTSRMFTCLDVGFNDLQLWVTDANGNQAWCLVTVDVQNNAANIPDCQEDFGAMPMHGLVKDSYGEALGNVYVSLRSRAQVIRETIIDTTYENVIVDSFYNAGGILIYEWDTQETYTFEIKEEILGGHALEIKSNSRGQFGTPDVELERNYNVTAYKVGDNSRVTDEDVNILSQYLEGQYEFTNPYSYIAADVDENKVINTDDLKILLSLSNGDEDEWPLERQWVFYDEKKLATMETDPMTEEMQPGIKLISEQGYGTSSFTGILKGDLSHYEQSFSSQDITERSKVTSTINVEVYPNPFTDFITVDMNAQSAKLTIQDINGRLVYEKQLTQSETQIDGSVLGQSGTYIYTIISGNDVLTGKVFKL